MALGRLATLTKVLAMLALSLGVSELALRIVHWRRPSFVFFSDDDHRFRLSPDTVFYGFRVNSLGFHDLEPESPKRDYRIVALGDSFATGVVPYAHNYLTLLEGTLERRLGRGVEVINMGIPRIGPNEYLSLLAREGLQLDPDHVLLSFFIGNDFIEVERPWLADQEWWEHSFVATLIVYLAESEHDNRWRSDHDK